MLLRAVIIILLSTPPPCVECRLRQCGWVERKLIVDPTELSLFDLDSGVILHRRLCDYLLMLSKIVRRMVWLRLGRRDSRLPFVVSSLSISCFLTSFQPFAFPLYCFRVTETRVPFHVSHIDSLTHLLICLMYARVCTQHGKTALDHAKQYGKHDVARLIEVLLRIDFIRPSAMQCSLGRHRFTNIYTICRATVSHCRRDVERCQWHVPRRSFSVPHRSLRPQLRSRLSSSLRC